MTVEKIKLEVGNVYFGRLIKKIDRGCDCVFYIWDNESDDVNPIQCKTATFKKYISKHQERAHK